MAAPTVIRWDTPGAPSLMRVASSIISVLDFCLLPIGWTKEWSDVDVAVYRPVSGDRKYYRVLNDGSFYYITGYQYTMAKISMYDSMSDVNTGAGLTGHAYISANRATDSTIVRPWVVIADEKGFFFIAFPHLNASSFTLSTAIGIVQYFGETVPALPGNTPRNVLSGGSLSMIPHYGSSIGCIENNLYTFVNRSLDGTRTNIKGSLQRNGGEPKTQSSSYPYGNSTYSPLSYPYNGELLYARPMLDDALDYTMGDYIPGLYYPCQKGHTLDSFQDYTADGKTLKAFRICSSNADISSVQGAALPNYNVGACLIDISAGFRA